MDPAEVKRLTRHERPATAAVAAPPAAGVTVPPDLIAVMNWRSHERSQPPVSPLKSESPGARPGCGLKWGEPPRSGWT